MDKMTARFWLLALAMVLCMATMWAYFWGLGPERYSTIEATRPVLVFTLIIAMLGFGTCPAEEPGAAPDANTVNTANAAEANAL